MKYLNPLENDLFSARNRKFGRVSCFRLSVWLVFARLMSLLWRLMVKWGWYEYREWTFSFMLTNDFTTCGLECESDTDASDLMFHNYRSKNRMAILTPFSIPLQILPLFYLFFVMHPSRNNHYLWCYKLHRMGLYKSSGRLSLESVVMRHVAIKW